MKTLAIFVTLLMCSNSYGIYGGIAAPPIEFAPVGDVSYDATHCDPKANLNCISVVVKCKDADEASAIESNVDFSADKRAVVLAYLAKATACDVDGLMVRRGPK